MALAFLAVFVCKFQSKAIYTSPVMFCEQALDLAALATENAQFKDWWWKVQLGKCYYR